MNTITDNATTWGVEAVKLNANFAELLANERTSQYFRHSIAVSALAETATHAAVMAIDTDPTSVERRGDVYIVYYSAEGAVGETSGTTKVILALTNVLNLRENTKYDVCAPGQVFASFTQATGVPVMDPYVILTSDKAFCKFTGNDGSKYVECVRQFDKATKEFAADVSILQLRWTVGETTYTEDMNDVNMATMVNDLCTLSYTYPSDVRVSLNTKIQLVGSIYYGFLGSIGAGVHLETAGSPGFIVKSTDLITWEVVTVITPAYFTAKASNWETGFVVVDGVIYCLIRTNGNANYRLASYTIATDTWSDTVVLGSDAFLDTGKPFVFYHNEKIYLIYNTNENPATGWFRGVLYVSVVNPTTLALTATQVVYAPKSCHYFHVEELDGELFMVFTEDKRGLDATQAKTNISIMPLDFLNI